MTFAWIYGSATILFSSFGFFFLFFPLRVFFLLLLQESKPVGTVHQFRSNISEVLIRKLSSWKLLICSKTKACKILRIFWIFLMPQNGSAASVFINGWWVSADSVSALVFNIYYSGDCACFMKFSWDCVVYNISKIENHPTIVVFSALIFLKYVYGLMLTPLMHACFLEAWVPLYFSKFVN